MEIVATLNFWFATGGLALGLVTLILIYDLKYKQDLLPLVRTYGLTVAFLGTLIVSALTLLYSEVFGFIPCGLCWLGRIMLYPQVFMLGTAIKLKDVLIARYGIVLSVAGLLVALYHHYLQMGGGKFIPCPATGSGADCAEKILFEFGFVTFPLLEAIFFAFLIVLYYYMLRASRTN